MSEVRIRSIMRRAEPTLAPETPIRRAAALLVEARAAAAPVIGEDGQLAGILSQKDCFRPALQASYYHEWKGRVADQMTAEVVTVAPDAELMVVAQLFLDCPHRVFPVVAGSEVEGVLYRSDVLARLMSLG